MTRFRWQRGGLEESLATTVDVRTLVELSDLVHTATECPGRVSVAPYYPRIDVRTGWLETHVVTMGGQAVGFTDGPLE